MDRLAELSDGLPAEGSAAAAGAGAVAVDVDGSGGSSQASPELNQFLQQVVGVQAAIQNIHSNSNNIRDLHAQVLRSVDAVETRQLNAEIGAHMDTVNQLSGEIKTALSAMDKDTTAWSAERAETAPAELRIRKTQHAHLQRAFVNGMKAYHTVLQDNKARLGDTIKRRIRARRTAEGTPITDEKAEELAMQALQQGTAGAVFVKSRDTLMQIEENHRDYVRIEAAMRDLLELFRDFAVLVEQQGELIDDILTNVSSANDAVCRGRTELREARRLAKKSKKRMMYILLVVACLALIIIVPSTVLPALAAKSKL
eukprot:TRINITY_DN4077_c0_g1_i1.p1 TRINITY_DN4077_c0_g1~~TRINITY_DN4077_c0_g1_i1.p1  ORF type:complete len:313 (+),score=71.82 TRINITY_DN4077_c0_g1_i1:93-1031(+)